MMDIIEDTRQKIGKHTKKNRYWSEHGDVVYRCSLPYGDYALAPKISVDTKFGLEEIAGNLCGARADRARVLREEKLARELGGKLIFLIETDEVSTKTDLLDKEILLRSGQIVLGEQLMRAMDEHEHVYGVEFRFCPPEKAGEAVKQLLMNAT